MGVIKNRKVKRIFLLGMLALLMRGADAFGADAAQSSAPEDILIDAANFPDEAFREYLMAYVDQDKDGALSQSERDAVTWIGNVRDMVPKKESSYSKKTNAEFRAAAKIRSFAGIEYFENLREIQLYYWAEVEELSLNNPKLQAVAIKSESLREFSVQNAENLRYFCLASESANTIDWDGIRNLTHLDAENLLVPFDVLLQNEKLVSVNLKGFETEEKRKSQEEIDFSALSLLEEFSIRSKEGFSGQIAETLNFSANSELQRVRVYEGMAKRMILPGKSTAYNKIAGQTMEIVFQEEEDFVLPKKLPKGSVALDKEHFPDASFRRYLYLYADTNRDNILSKEERAAVKRIRNDHYDYDKSFDWNEGNYDCWSPEEEEEFAVASQIMSLEGISYFPNLYEIQLKGITLSPEVEEISISNPKLKYLDFSFYGNVKKINLSGCKKLYLCAIFANKGEGKVQAAIDFSGADCLAHLELNGNAKLSSIRSLPKKEKLRLLRVCQDSFAEEDVALIRELSGLKKLTLFLSKNDALPENSVFETIDLSENTKLTKVKIYGRIAERFVLPEKSVKTYFYNQAGKKPEIVYAK